MFRLAFRYPKVRAGSTIVVGSKQVREEKDDRELKPIDMNQVIATLAATVSSFATMYVLITR